MTIRAERERAPKAGPVPACYRLGLTFFEWFWGQSLEPLDSECWEWQGSRFQSGYGRSYIPWDGARADYAHRISWTLARGPIPLGLDVLHHCDNPPCIRPSHLFLGTDQDNAIDRERKGRGAFGSKNPNRQRNLRKRMERRKAMAVIQPLGQVSA